MSESDSERVDSIVDEDRGSGRAVADPRQAGTGEVRLAAVAGEASLRAAGHWKDDEDPSVTLSVAVDGGHVDVAMTPEEARRFAADLRSAATQALQGDAELTPEEQ